MGQRPNLTVGSMLTLFRQILRDWLTLHTLLVVVVVLLIILLRQNMRMLRLSLVTVKI